VNEWTAALAVIFVPQILIVATLLGGLLTGGTWVDDADDR
jgi:hypothetical protein